MAGEPADTGALMTRARLLLDREAGKYASMPVEHSLTMETELHDIKRKARRRRQCKEDEVGCLKRCVVPVVSGPHQPDHTTRAQ